MNEKDLSILEETIDYKFNDQKWVLKTKVF